MMVPFTVTCWVIVGRAQQWEQISKRRNRLERLLLVIMVQLKCLILVHLDYALYYAVMYI